MFHLYPAQGINNLSKIINNKINRYANKRTETQGEGSSHSAQRVWTPRPSSDGKAQEEAVH
jgi:hypothetical protein